MLLRPNQPNLPLTPKGEDRFRIAGASEAPVVRVERSSEKKVEKVVFEQPSGTFEFRPVKPFEAPMSLAALMGGTSRRSAATGRCDAIARAAAKFQSILCARRSGEPARSTHRHRMLAQRGSP